MLQVQLPWLATSTSAVLGPSIAASEPAVRSEAEILESDSLIGDVIDKLQLARQIEASSLRRRLLQLIGLEHSAPVPLPRDQLIAWYKKRLTVRNDDKTLILTVSFVADAPQLAAQIAQTHAELYLAQQMDRKTQMIHKAVSWLTSRIGMLEAAIAQHEAAIVSLQQPASGLGDLSRQLEAEKTMYNDLLLRRSQIEADPAGQEADAWVVSSALPPSTPLFPSGSVLVLAGGVAGFLLMACVFAAREAFSTRIRDVDDLTYGVGLSALGIFPKVPRHETFDLCDKPGSFQVHEINRIRHRLSSALGTGPGRTILVTSALPGEGKSTLSLALARSFAADGEKTLLVELDLYHPVLKQKLKLDGEYGTLAVLGRRKSLTESLQKDRRSDLRILMSEGTISPDRAVSTSANLHALFAEARAHFDVIIIDTSPMAAIPDSLALCRHVNASVLAVRCDITPAPLVRATGEHLLDAGVTMIGAVLVGYDPTNHRYAPHEYASYHKRLSRYFQP